MKKLLWILPIALLAGCTYDNLGDEAAGYPSEISAIIVHRCATSGCHNAQSAEAAAGLNLSTWESLYLGSNGGSAVIPYSPDQSYLLYAVNTDTSNGDPALFPTMPIGGAPLTPDEYALLKQWIIDGARNLKDEERFPPIASRRKWYVTNQGCDVVAVLDAESRQVMRYVPIGSIPGFGEYPHNIKVSKDGLYWYVIYMVNNPRLEKYSTLTDQKLGEINIGPGQWNTFTIAPNGKFGVAVSFEAGSGPGDLTVVIVDLVHNAVTEQLQFGVAVHGSAAHPTLPRFYVTQQLASSLNTIDYDSNGRATNTDVIDLVQGVQPHNGSTILGPHEVIFSPDGSKYFVSCESADEVRVYNATTDALITVINVGDDPVEFALSPQTGHLFVTCMEDVTSFPSEPFKHGSVAIIDYNTNTLIKSVYTGHQPHGIIVDEAAGMAIVTNRNVSANGPAPHHTSNCGGRNGYLTAIDLNTLNLVPGFKSEMSADPYAIALKK